MKPSEESKLVAQLVQHEGLRLKPYTDTVGKTTIGVGRNLTDKGISHEEAVMLLGNDIARIETDFLQRLPWIADLNAVRRRVLFDMAFNLGVDGLLTFTHTLAAIKQGDYEGGARGMLASKWATQVGRRASRLAQMMRTGEEA
jgi:lysozyme